MATESEHATAIRALLETPLGKWSAYDYDDVPSPAPGMYALVTVTRRYGNDLRLSGGRKLVGYRLTSLAVGRTVDEARWVRQQVASVIDDQHLTIGGRTSTFVRFETETPVELDDGYYSGITNYTYAI